MIRLDTAPGFRRRPVRSIWARRCAASRNCGAWSRTQQAVHRPRSTEAYPLSRLAESDLRRALTFCAEVAAEPNVASIAAERSGAVGLPSLDDALSDSTRRNGGPSPNRCARRARNQAPWALRSAEGRASPRARADAGFLRTRTPPDLRFRRRRTGDSSTTRGAEPVRRVNPVPLDWGICRWHSPAAQRRRRRPKRSSAGHERRPKDTDDRKPAEARRCSATTMRARAVRAGDRKPAIRIRRRTFGAGSAAASGAGRSWRRRRRKVCRLLKRNRRCQQQRVLHRDRQDGKAYAWRAKIRCAAVQSWICRTSENAPATARQFRSALTRARTALKPPELAELDGGRNCLSGTTTAPDSRIAAERAGTGPRQLL